MRARRVGVLGEDRSDVETLATLVRRIVPGVGVRQRAPATGGCSMLRRKLPTFMRELALQGCGAIVVVHDLDRSPDNGELNDEAALRTKLAGLRPPEGVERLICIPIEELEAWFWADQGVLDLVGRGLGQAHPSPHRIARPKEKLYGLSMRAHRKPIYSTNMNPLLAEKLALEVCADRCPSFRELRDFLLRVTPG